jgi:ketosteroid isomerase-like protein
VLNREGAAAALPYFSDDFEGVVPPDLSAEPDAYRGHAGLLRYFELFEEVVDGLRFEAERLTEVAPGALVGLAFISGRGRESGIPVEMRVPLAVAVREGRIARMDAYADWDDALAAARAFD